MPAAGAARDGKSEAAAGDCKRAHTASATVSGSGPYGAIVLADGTMLRPADVWIAGDAVVLERGTQVHYHLVARSPDRWGRWPARLAVIGAGDDWLERRLVLEGRALVRPETGAGPCIEALLAAEVSARAASRGIWNDVARPVPADRLDALSPHYGTFLVTEGFVRTVGVRERQTYLNFGRRWNESLAVVMSKSLWTQAASRSMTASALEGKRVRVRGVLERGAGPTIRIGRLDEIEVLGER